jgi:hypothetical protein
VSEPFLQHLVRDERVERWIEKQAAGDLLSRFLLLKDIYLSRTGADGWVHRPVFGPLHDATRRLEAWPDSHDAFYLSMFELERLVGLLRAEGAIWVPRWENPDDEGYEVAKVMLS